MTLRVFELLQRHERLGSRWTFAPGLLVVIASHFRPRGGCCVITCIWALCANFPAQFLPSNNWVESWPKWKGADVSR